MERERKQENLADDERRHSHRKLALCALEYPTSTLIGR